MDTLPDRGVTHVDKL